MPTKQKIIEQLENLSTRISTQVRTVALGLLVIIWGLLIGTFKVELTDNLKTQLMIIGGVSILTLFFDFLQYFFGYWNAKTLLEKMEKGKKQEGKYDYKSLSYKLRDWLFWIKQVLVTVGVVWFLVILSYYVVLQI